MAINIPSAHSKFIRIGCAYRSVKQNFYTDILPTVSSRSISIQRIESITSWNKTNKLSSLTDQPIKSISQNRGYTTYIAQHLADRTLIRVSGQEAAEFLQGLVTNDIDHLKNNPNEGMLLFTASSNSKLIASNEEIENASPLLNRSIYAMFLNTSGRVMFDVIITRLLTDTFVIDCNIEFAPKLVKHLKMYRVRRKIDLSIRDRCEIWAVFCKDIIKPGDLSNRSMAEDFVNLGISPDGVVSTIDPRMKQLGFRIAVLDRGSETAKKLNSMKLGSMDDHKELRFRLGVGECPSELHPGKALPLESNADYLHGVSFHKGCYIGQELTARTHHTGVIRKRIMPLIIHNPRDVPLESELNLHNENSKKSVGKLKSYVNEYGIGLMRVEDCLHAQNNGESIVVSDKNDITVKVLKPDWWPETSLSKLPDK